MPRKPKDISEAKGTIEWKNGCYHARVSVPGSTKRGRIKLRTPEGRWLDRRGSDEALARKYATKLSEDIRSDAYEHQVRELNARTKVEELGTMWTDGTLFEMYGEVYGLKVKASARDDRNRLCKNLYPAIGKMAVADVQEGDIIRAFARANAEAITRNGKPFEQASKIHLYQVTKRLFDLAVKPCRLRADNPVNDDLRPKKGAPKLYGYLYPAELVTLLGCEAVPIARRVYYALGCYTGLRKASLRAFVWNSIDFQHKTITSLVSKTDFPQMFAQADAQLTGLSSLITLLERYHQLQGFPAGDAPVIRRQDLRCKKDGEATALREDLKAAGIDREILFTKSNKVVPLRFHDLRATFVTWARRAGKGYGWISDRTGQLTPAIQERYNRGARTLQDLQYEPFPDISAAIPELSRLPKNVTRLKR